MKRLLVLTVLAALCLGLLASPAFAAKGTDHYRLPEGVPLLPAFGGGWWSEYEEATGDPNLDLAWWQAGAMPNYGIQLRPDSHGAPSNEWNQFYSSDYLDDPALRPQLVIESSASVGR